MLPSITLHAHKITPILRGHPWIFPQAIRQQDAAQTGELVHLYSPDQELIGTGIYNEHSMYRVRVLTRSHESLSNQDLASIIAYRLKMALGLRQRLNLPNASTNAYRLFNSEADGLSGLTIDRFDQVCVVSSSAFWVEKNYDLICSELQQLLPETRILWLSQSKALKQDGWNHAPIPNPTLDPIIVQEAGIRYHIDFAHAQKTGLFLDQRDNHVRLASYVQGARVLDLYTYTGGFGLHAAQAGAHYVLSVDSSAMAIAQAKSNAALNQLSNIEFVEADARDYLSRAGEFDVIILDPPKLMPSKRNQNQAKNYYRFLHQELFKAMRPNTLFMSCNCSSAIQPHEFTQLIFQQASRVNQTARILGVYGPSVCHPTLPVFPEGNYLTAVLGIIQ